MRKVFVFSKTASFPPIAATCREKTSSADGTVCACATNGANRIATVAAQRVRIFIRILGAGESGVVITATGALCLIRDILQSIDR